MRVTINQYHSFLSKAKKKIDFVHNIISTLLVRYPGVQIELLSNDNSYQQNLPKGIAFTHIEIPSLLKPIAGRNFISIAKKIVSKNQPDLLISGITSRLGINIPEYLLVTESLQKNIIKQKSADGIIAPSVFVKDDLIRRGIDANKILLVRVLPDELFLPAGWEEREKVKLELTNGKEYFMLNAENTSRDFIVNVLKAFSIFKKWQQSNMQLLVINPDETKITGDLLLTYKYRNDVKLISAATPSELAKYTKAAMAYIALPENDITGYSTVIALQCEVPAISYSIGAIEETGADAILYVNPDSSEDIAGKMIKLYKDEKLRAQLIQKSKERMTVLKQENNSIQFQIT